MTFILRPRPLLGQRIQIDGDRIVHVQHGGLHDRGQVLRQALGLATLHETAHLVGDHPLHDPFEHQRVATDIPARLQTEARMGAADGRDGFHIMIVQLAGADQRPVGFLFLLGMGDMGIAGEEAGRFGMRFGACIEIVERRTDGRLDQRLEAAEARTLFCA